MRVSSGASPAQADERSLAMADLVKATIGTGAR